MNNQPEVLISEIKSLGIAMTLRGKDLHLVGRLDAISKDHQERLRKAKPEIIKILSKTGNKVYTIGTKHKGSISYHSMIDRSGDSIEEVRQSLKEKFGERFVSVKINI
jgi:hypothetical protein